MPDIRILIVSSDPLARAGLATLLATQPGCAVVAQSSDDADIEQMIDVYQPDVTLWDLGVNSADAVERYARNVSNRVPSMVLLANGTDAMPAWGAGARGLIMRNADANVIASAIHAISKGLVTASPELAATLIPSRALSGVTDHEELTPREGQVLELMAQGQPNKEIARRLGISEHTVKFHVNSILGKLHATSRTEAVILATRSGLVMI